MRTLHACDPSPTLTHAHAVCLLQVAAIDQLCFPEMLGKMFNINAPSIFVAVWKVIKVRKAGKIP